MTDTVTIKVDSRNVEAMLAKLDTALSPMALATFLEGETAPWLQERAAQRFRSEGDDASGKWAPLLPETQRIRASGTQMGVWTVGPDHPINVRTHELENYITGNLGYTIPIGTGANLVFPDDRTATTSIRQKMQTAQRGRSNPRTRPRPVLAMNATDMEYVLNHLANHVTTAVQ